MRASGWQFIFTILILLSCNSGAEESLTLAIDSRDSVVSSVTAGEGFPQSDQLPRGEGGRVIVTTDQLEVVRYLPQMFALGDSVVLLPYGPNLVKNFGKTTLGELIAKAKKNTLRNFKEDRIGFIMATIGLGADAFTWLHMTNMSDLNITGNILFSLIFVLKYGYNKDNWGKATKPLSNGIRRLFTESERWTKGGAKDLAVVFTSSFIYGAAWYFGRGLLFPPDRLLDLSFQVSSLTVPILMSLVATFANFSWSQGIWQIDEKEHPGAKYIGRSLMNLKGLVLSIFATTAALMNPDVFGYGAWVALLGSGITGMWFYRNFEKHYAWADYVGENVQRFFRQTEPVVPGITAIQCVSLL